MDQPEYCLAYKGNVTLIAISFTYAEQDCRRLKVRIYLSLERQMDVQLSWLVAPHRNRSSLMTLIRSTSSPLRAPLAFFEILEPFDQQFRSLLFDLATWQLVHTWLAEISCLYLLVRLRNSLVVCKLEIFLSQDLANPCHCVFHSSNIRQTRSELSDEAFFYQVFFLCF